MWGLWHVPRLTADFGHSTFRRYSSVVERTLGKGEAESPILSSGTTFFDFSCIINALHEMVPMHLRGWC